MVEVRVARSPAEREQALAVRRRVFVDEQAVPLDLEIDEHEDVCRHFIAVDGGRVVGAARLRGIERGYKVERVAVLASHRGRGIGAALVRAVIEQLPDNARGSVVLNAQQSAIGFWERLGFVAEGPVFDEAGIPHRAMRLG